MRNQTHTQEERVKSNLHIRHECDIKPTQTKLIRNQAHTLEMNATDLHLLTQQSIHYLLAERVDAMGGADDAVVAAGGDDAAVASRSIWHLSPNG